jgi:hypothetical protein
MQARAANSAPGPEKTANKLALEDAQTASDNGRMRLSVVFCPFEDASPPDQRSSFGDRCSDENQARLDTRRRIKFKVVTIPTDLMNSYTSNAGST